MLLCGVRLSVRPVSVTTRHCIVSKRHNILTLFHPSILDNHTILVYRTKPYGSTLDWNSGTPLTQRKMQEVRTTLDFDQHLPLSQK